MRPLVDMLPPCAEYFTLRQVLREKDASNLLRGLAEIKQERLPELKKITVNRMPDSWDDNVKSKLKHAGVRFFSFNTEL